eukprot:TRINITY_DN1500_c0_g1_i1.p1 TRINITY_DN1500_c0_g1~~TRINITY_DN1500_c0_g1_i1.p1  ORF type:complete len:502 (+),score=72.80 TRINITY_DN1500_c0_g1_i1:20-1525(+)
MRKTRLLQQVLIFRQVQKCGVTFAWLQQSPYTKQLAQFNGSSLTKDQSFTLWSSYRNLALYSTIAEQEEQENIPEGTEASLTASLNDAENLYQLESVLNNAQDSLTKDTFLLACHRMGQLDGLAYHFSGLISQQVLRFKDELDDAETLYQFARDVGVKRLILKQEARTALQALLSKNVQNFNAEQCQSVIHKAVMLGLRSHNLIRDLVRQLCAQIEDATNEAIGKTIWAVGVKGTKIAQQELDTLRATIMQRMDTFDKISTTQIMRGIAEMGWRDTLLLEALRKLIKSKLDDESAGFTSPRVISTVLYSLAKLNYLEWDFVQPLLQIYKNTFPTFNEKDVIDYLVCFSQFPNLEAAEKAEVRECFDMLLSFVNDNVQVFHCGQLSLILEAIVEQRLDVDIDKELLEKLIEAVRQDHQNLNIGRAAVVFRMICCLHQNGLVENVDTDLTRNILERIQRQPYRLSETQRSDVYMAAQEVGLANEQMRETLVYSNQGNNYDGSL